MTTLDSRWAYSQATNGGNAEDLWTPSSYTLFLASFAVNLVAENSVTSHYNLLHFHYHFRPI